MVNPLFALLIAFAVAGILAVIFWPEKGILAIYRKAKNSTSRVIIEDALKHLYDYEERNVRSTLRSISGHLSLSGNETTMLVSKLAAMGLIEHKDDAIQLTDRKSTRLNSSHVKSSYAV